MSTIGLKILDKPINIENILNVSIFFSIKHCFNYFFYSKPTSS